MRKADIDHKKNRSLFSFLPFSVQLATRRREYQIKIVFLFSKTVGKINNNLKLCS